jgi:hypothetical protein
MDVRIDFTQDDCDCLLDKLPTESLLHRLFEPPARTDLTRVSGGLPPGGEVIINCSKADAEDLLKVADVHCPGASYSIKEAIRFACAKR